MSLILQEGFCLIAREGYQSLFLKMPVNVIQYRVTVGIFNNCTQIINLGLDLPPCSKLSNDLAEYGPTYIPLLFHIFLSVFLFSNGLFRKLA